MSRSHRRRTIGLVRGVADPLGQAHGFSVVAVDGPCGAVQTPVFPPNTRDPDFVVVRVPGPPARYRLVPAAAVLEVDRGRELVRLGLTRAQVARLSERLPLD